MTIMLNIPNKQHKSLFHIKTMHDSTREALYGIRNLGVDITSWDLMIVHILGQRLDLETYDDYLNTLKNSKDLPVLNEFLNFLEKKFTTLETALKKSTPGRNR